MLVSILHLLHLISQCRPPQNHSHVLVLHFNSVLPHSNVSVNYSRFPPLCWWGPAPWAGTRSHAADPCSRCTGTGAWTLQRGQGDNTSHSFVLYVASLWPPCRCFCCLATASWICTQQSLKTLNQQTESPEVEARDHFVPPGVFTRITEGPRLSCRGDAANTGRDVSVGDGLLINRSNSDSIASLVIRLPHKENKELLVNDEAGSQRLLHHLYQLHHQ